MRKLCVASLFFLAAAANAQAAMTTFVSSTGSDTGNCPAAAPCRTFAFAASRTDAGGTLHVLTSGTYGPVTIARSISILAEEGVEAIIDSVAPSDFSDSAAVYVNAAPGSTVHLKGLTIDPHSSVGSGVQINSPGVVEIEDSLIQNADSGVIALTPASPLFISVNNSTISNNRLNGIFIDPSGVSGVIIRVALNNVILENNGFSGGYDGASFIARRACTMFVTVRETLADRNGFGIVGAASPGGKLDMTIDRSTLSNNRYYGLAMAGSPAAIARLGNSTLSGNQAAISTEDGAQVLSYGTNKLDGNITSSTPSGRIDYQ